MEKNSVIKLGRVRLRVRDIDYKLEANPAKALNSYVGGSSGAINIDDIEIEDIGQVPKYKKKYNDTNFKEREKNVTTLSDEALCRICWGTESEDA